MNVELLESGGAALPCRMRMVSMEVVFCSAKKGAFWSILTPRAFQSKAPSTYWVT